MKRSLAIRLAVIQALLMVVALALLGFVQWRGTTEGIGAMIDQDLRGRVRGFEDPNRPGMRMGPRGGLGPPPGPQGPGRPRLFDRNGQAMNPNETPVPWDKVMLAASLRGQTQLQTITTEQGTFRVISAPIRDREEVVGAVQIAADLAPFALARQAQQTALLSSIPLVMAAAVLVAFLLSRWILDPLRGLAEAARRIAARPSDLMPSAGGRVDEVGQLADAMATMTSNLQTSNRDLASALERQTRFTSDAAHELRTPLTSIRLAADNGLHPEATVEDQRRSLEIVARNADSIGQLSEVLLTLARLDHRQEKLPKTPTALPDVVESAVEDAGLSGDPRLVLQVPVQAVALTNAAALKQILRNVLENAAHHTPENGTIELTVGAGKIVVRDTGTGISPEHLPHLFDRFYRADEARTRTKNRFGLGLAIVKALADGLDIEVQVKSQVGVGTEFALRFEKSDESS